MSRAFFAICLALVAALAATPAQAGPTESKSYTVASTPVISLSCTDCGLEGLNIGGVTFAPTGLQPMRVTVSDTLQGAVGFTVCQNFDNDNFCGGDLAGTVVEPSIIACGTEAELGPDFDPAFEVLVFVRFVEAGCGYATTGSVTMEYADADGR